LWNTRGHRSEDAQGRLIRTSQVIIPPLFHCFDLQHYPVAIHFHGRGIVMSTSKDGNDLIIIKIEERERRREAT